jgi:hypothetical protein
MEKAKDTEEVQQILKNKGYLCAISNFVVPGQELSELKFSFFDPKTEQITEVACGNAGARVDATGRALRNATKALKWEDAKVDVNAAMKTALAELKKKFGTPVQKIIVSLTADNSWSFICITKTFSTVNVLIDAKSGKVLECAEDSIL